MRFYERRFRIFLGQYREEDEKCVKGEMGGMVRKDGSELGFMCEKGEKEDEKRELLVYSKS